LLSSPLDMRAGRRSVVWCVCVCVCVCVVGGWVRACVWVWVCVCAHTHVTAHVEECVHRYIYYLLLLW